MKQEKTMTAGLIKTAKMHVERLGKSKKKVKKTSSSSFESEYIESSHDSESSSDETFSLPGSDSEMQDGHTLAQVVSSIKKRKNLQREGRSQKRTK
ncbi:hypothetical protein PIB30_056950 [Stylosanthes scabra]|uniref:Uncharacterized protein n=1 Tax=Stylosanthes scabra TaxID=79078 RepID=A0ABU6VMN7_9FABA|nr:hypothetical protein [Stylosanthes scabra]